MKRLRSRWTVSLLLAALALCAYAWTLATPEIGGDVRLPPPSGDRLWSFGFVGDTQLGEGIVDVVFERFEKAEVDFVLHLGDIVDDASSCDQWKYVLGEARRHHIRLRPVVGNHDRLVGTSDRGETRFREFFPDVPDTFYRFSHRGLEFVMLNSERSLLPWTQQGRFLNTVLGDLSDRSSDDTAIVCLHRPVFTCGRRDLANQFLRRVWLHSRLLDTPARLVLSGHHHYYDRTKPLDGITYVVSGGGSHKLYPAADPDQTTAAFRAGVNHYGLVDVYADRLDVRVLDLDDQELDRFTVKRTRTATEGPPVSALSAKKEDRAVVRR
ncbi:MAG TPA: metallophosphoesterase [Pirellulales bacterium]|nr:metallophosphoesterase [Pirellulales bacterium]